MDTWTLKTWIHGKVHKTYSCGYTLYTWLHACGYMATSMYFVCAQGRQYIRVHWFLPFTFPDVSIHHCLPQSSTIQTKPTEYLFQPSCQNIFGTNLKMVTFRQIQLLITYIRWEIIQGLIFSIYYVSWDPENSGTFLRFANPSLSAPN